MSPFSLIPIRWRIALARGLIKAAALPIVPEWFAASFLEPTWHNLVRDGWKKNAAVYGCVSALAMSFPEPPLAVYRDGEPVSRHPLQDRLRRPNPLMGEAEFACYLITWLALGGNVYVHKVRDRAGRVVELWPYHAGHITPRPGPMEWVAGYEFDRGDGRKTIIPRQDVIHIKWPLPDPDQPWMATPPILHAAREVDTDNEATRYLFALLKNDALPRTVIEMPGEVKLDADQYKRLKRQFNDRYGGDKRGGVGLLEGGAKMSRVGLDLQELAFEALRRVPEARIAAAFRVPAIVAGLNVGLERATYANYKEAVAQMTEGTLVPLWRLVADELTQGLASEKEFAGLTIAYDLSNVRALQENETEKWGRLDVAVRGGWMTVNEARGRIGLDEVPGGDVFLRPIALITERADRKPAEPPAPEPEKALSSGNGRQPPHRWGMALAEDKQTQREAARRVGETLQAIRSATVITMTTAIDDYFKDLAQRVVGRAVNYEKHAAPAGAKADEVADEAAEVEELPPVDALLEPEDFEELLKITRRFYADLLHISWGVWDVALGTVVAFDLNDPLVTSILDQAGGRIKDINDTTRQEVVDLLKYGSDNGWSVDRLVRGDADEGISGLRDIVEETYKNRARAIARTELGTAQQLAAAGRYGDAGVKEILILDDGFPNSDENCVFINGQVRPLEWAGKDHPNEGPSGIKNPLQHPNCVRCFAPHFGG